MLYLLLVSYSSLKLQSALYLFLFLVLPFAYQITLHIIMIHSLQSKAAVCVFVLKLSSSLYRMTDETLCYTKVKG